MSMESHVTNIELSKKLWELEVRQASNFWWMRLNGDEQSFRLCFYPDMEIALHISRYSEIYSAFLATELLKGLPKLIRYDDATYQLNIKVKNKCLKVCYELCNEDPSEFFNAFYDESFANVVAKTLIGLFEDKLITVEEVNRRMADVPKL